MQYFYSKATKGFYIEGINDIPLNAKPITESYYQALLNGQTEGKQIVGDEKGYPVLVDPQPSPFHQLVEGKWVISSEKQTALLEQHKNQLIEKLADKTDSLKSQLLVGYPQTEIDSFYRQEAEALAYRKNPSAPTPMLHQIAQSRQVPFALLVEKVLEKSNAFAYAIGGVIGMRQGFEDRILAAQNQDELEQIEKEVDAWQLSI